MYQQAPATTMLNTKCAACGRALVDAASVQAGLGPHCRKAYLYEGMTDELRKNANEVIQRCAKDNVPAEELLRAVVELSLMGCDKLSERISRRAGTIIAEFTKESLRLSVKGSPKALLRELIHVRGKRLYRAGGRTVFDLPGGFAGRALVAVRRAYGDRAVLNVQGLPEMQSRPPFMYANDTGVAEMFANHDVAFEPTPEEMDAEREQQLAPGVGNLRYAPARGGGVVGEAVPG